MVAELPVLNNGGEPFKEGAFSPSGCDPNARCGAGLEKILPTCAVRYGALNYIGEFKYAPGMLFGCGAKVVIKSNRGIEIGRQVSLTCTGCEKSVSRKQMAEYARNSGQDSFRLRSGRILREATQQDLEEERHINQDSDKKLARARELAAERQLPMKFVTCEHLFGGERIIFQFMSEGRVDFRDLVRELAHEYHTRIEMHQVGARDEARLVADYEICGRECCCKDFLKTLRPVTMRMAKLQKATLDPSKVSGRCGRLRCCLRYEHESYEELNKKVPKVGVRVRTETGIGTIKDRQILTQLLVVVYDDGGVPETVPLEDVLERDLPKAPPKAEPDTASGRRRNGIARSRESAGTRQRDTAAPPDGRKQRQRGPGRPSSEEQPQREGPTAGRPESTSDGDAPQGPRKRRRRRGRRRGGRPEGKK